MVAGFWCGMSVLVSFVGHQYDKHLFNIQSNLYQAASQGSDFKWLNNTDGC